MPRRERADEKAPGPTGFTRRVQRTGSSSLAITLPKAWTDSMNLQTGDSLRFRDLGEGRLEISPVRSEDPGARRQKLLRIDATELPPKLLARLLIGAYITGQDQVVVSARTALSVAQRSEIRRTVAHVLGMTVVEEEAGTMEVQNFIDPGKHHFQRLMGQVVRILRSELETCRAVLDGADPGALHQLAPMEDEVDRYYLLMVRQLLLSSDDFQVARDIGVESHHFQIGSRLIAKVLEMVGDLVSEVARELGDHLPGLRRLPPAARASLVTLLTAADRQLEGTMDAFVRLSVVGANATLNEIEAELLERQAFGDKLARRVADRGVAVAAQRIVSQLLMTLEMLVIINEVTINRSVEPETVSKTDRKVVLDRGDLASERT